MRDTSGVSGSRCRKSNSCRWMRRPTAGFENIVLDNKLNYLDVNKAKIIQTNGKMNTSSNDI